MRIQPVRRRAMSDVLENRARRVAWRAGYIARKSRWRRGTVDNHGGFMIIEPYRNRVEAGVRFDMSAQDVIDWCEGLPANIIKRPA
jgi:hypothetical protein